MAVRCAEAHRRGVVCTKNCSSPGWSRLNTNPECGLCPSTRAPRSTSSAVRFTAASLLGLSRHLRQRPLRSLPPQLPRPHIARRAPRRWTVRAAVATVTATALQPWRPGVPRPDDRDVDERPSRGPARLPLPAEQVGHRGVPTARLSATCNYDDDLPCARCGRQPERRSWRLQPTHCPQCHATALAHCSRCHLSFHCGECYAVPSWTRRNRHRLLHPGNACRHALAGSHAPRRPCPPGPHS